MAFWEEYTTISLEKEEINEDLFFIKLSLDERITR